MTTLDTATVREVFRRNMFCTIATASPTGDPWLSPVFFNYSPEYALVWESAHDALHSHNIRINPRVAIFIKDTTTKLPGTDVYMVATAHEVAPQHLPEALHTWQTGPHGHSDRSQRELGDYDASKPLRLYEASIQRLYVLRETVVDGYRVDARLEMDVAELSEGASRPAK
jgi:hypothetical protein